MTRSVKKLFLLAALAGAVTAGVLLAQPDASVSESFAAAPSAADVMREAAGVVEQNKAQPCADELAGQSAIRMTEPGMSCK